jgi:hypothetical protein
MSPTPARLLAATVGGAATTAYYATPDVIRSRTARGWAKAALLLVATAATLPDARATWQHKRTAEPTPLTSLTWQDAADEVEAPGDDAPAPSFRSLPARKQAVIAGVGAAVMAGSVWATVATERWLYRRAETRRVAGARWAHTRTGLVMGGVAAALALIPDPPEGSDAPTGDATR